MKSPTALLTGASGQLGTTLQAMWPQCAVGDTLSLVPLTRAQLDISDPAAVDEAIADYAPAIIINAAAYNGVDQAEDEPEQALAINSLGVGNLARALGRVGGRLIHVSTDFVFDGSACSPYPETAETAPLGAYGRSKQAGEVEALTRLPDTSCVIRTSWLYSPHANNFVKTMLRLMGERDRLTIVADQQGAPTSTRTLALMIVALLERPALSGIFHWSDSGVISWYDFAVAIQEEALQAGLLTAPIELVPVSSDEYITRAERPRYSVLDLTRAESELGMTASPWRDELRAVIRDLATQGAADHNKLETP